MCCDAIIDELSGKKPLHIFYGVTNPFPPIGSRQNRGATDMLPSRLSHKTNN